MKSCLVALSCVLSIVGCNSRASNDNLPAEAGKSRRVVAVSYALQYLTQRIAGDSILVEFPSATAADPRKWKPTVADIASLQRSELIVVNGQGAEYAQWLVQATLPPSILCESCEDFKLKDQISVRDFQVVHSHGPGGEHSHSWMVPYPWLDPSMAIKQSEKIAQCLAQNWPESAPTFETNLKSLKSDLQLLKDDLQKIAARQQPSSTVVITANPNLKYLTRAAGLDDRHLLWFDWPEASEWSKQRLELEKEIADLSETSILVTELPGGPIAAYLDEHSIVTVLIDTLDLRPRQGDFLSAMRDNISRIDGLQKMVDSADTQ